MIYRVLFILAFSLLAWANSSAQEGVDRMGYTIVTDASDRQIMVMWGPIQVGETDDRARFLSFARSNPGIREFWLASGGGNPDAAMNIGQLIRKTRLPVRVPSYQRLRAAVEREQTIPGRAMAVAPLATWVQNRKSVQCSSACGYLLIAGEARFVDREFSVGLHASRADAAVALMIKLSGNADPEFVNTLYKDFERSMQNAVARKGTFLADMSVSLGYSEISTAVPAQCMYYLSASEMTQLNLTNVNGFQTQSGGSQYGKCDCWAISRSDPEFGKYNRVCEQSARSRSSVWVID